MERRMADYDPLENWTGELRRIMTVDVQGRRGRHYYCLVRAWGAEASSRLLHWQVCWSIEEVRELQKTWKVDSGNVAIDSGAYTSEIYQNVVDSGYKWKPMKGEDKEYFLLRGMRRLYNTTTADPAIGTQREGRVRMLRLYLYAKYGCLDRMTNLMHGVFGNWRLPKKLDGLDDYLHQVCAYDRREESIARREHETKLVWYRRSKEDHLASCEIMQVAAASASGMLNVPGHTPVPLPGEQTEELPLDG